MKYGTITVCKGLSKLDNIDNIKFIWNTGLQGSIVTHGLKYIKEHDDSEWGAQYQEVQDTAALANIFICQVNISDIEKISQELARMVMDQSWIMNLEPTAQQAYGPAVKQTAKALQTVFQNKLTDDNKIAKEFGEIMVSMGASRALAKLFDHISIPISELWKPKKKQNEGFDFHTVCTDKLINFGEAKFSGAANPYGGKSGSSSGAGGQADGFISADKHKMDGVHLAYLAGKEAETNLNNHNFGVILAFSLNSSTPLGILKNAVDTAKEYLHLKKAQKIYLVGVRHAGKN